MLMASRNEKGTDSIAESSLCLQYARAQRCGYDSFTTVMARNFW